MGLGTYKDQVDNITAPIAGLLSAFAVTATAGAQDLSKCGQQKSSNVDAGASQLGLVNSYVELQADGGDVYVCFGATLAAVSAGNVPNPATTGVNAAGACVKIPNGTSRNVRLTTGTQFMGYVTSTGTATLRVWADST